VAASRDGIMTGISAALGALFGAGVFLFIRALTGVAPTSHGATTVARRLSGLSDHFDRFALRCVIGAAASVGIGVLTGWPVGMAVAAAGGFAAPSLLGAKSRRQAAEARLAAIATWTEQLRDVMAATAGLEQAIAATAEHAPPSIRPDVMWLAGALHAGTGPRTALRRFAGRLDDPAGDLVVAALILAAEGSPRQLGDLLGRLAATTRDTVKMRLRIETSRARTRSSVKLVTSVTVVFSTLIVVFNPTYVHAYQSPVGQVVLLVVASVFAGAYRWLAKAGNPASSGRFLEAGAAAAHAYASVRRPTMPEQSR
jgi:tight adherence protein B